MASIFINKIQYDISNFDHPGKAVIFEYEGRDATDVFNAFHPKSAYLALNKLPTLKGSPKVDEKLNENEFERDVRALHYDLLKGKRYIASKRFYTFVVLRNLAFLLIAFYVPNFISCFFIALFMQQSGWLSHDILHNQIFANTKLAEIFGGYFVGCLCQGFSGSWWKSKHNTHHASPNVEEHDPDIDTAPLLAWSATLLKKSLSDHPTVFKICLKYQHFLFFPLLTIARWSWCFQSILTSAKQGELVELLFLGAHWALKVQFSLSHGGWCYFFLTEILASLSLSIVFSLNHNPLPTLEEDAVNMGFYEHQLRTARNYSGGVFIDFITGGLSYQIEHHVIL